MEIEGGRSRREVFLEKLLEFLNGFVWFHG